MNLNSKLKVSDDIFVQEVDGDTVILNTATQEYFTLDESGKILWNFINESTNLNEVINKMHEYFEVDENQLKGDVTTFIENLKSKKLLDIE